MKNDFNRSWIDIDIEDFFLQNSSDEILFTFITIAIKGIISFYY